MYWITRARPKTDRIACPWLIRRFIDPSAQFLFVPPDSVVDLARAIGGRSFDAKDADYTHRPAPGGAGPSQWCTFEVLIADHDLHGDPALNELARIVHAADIAGDQHLHPVAAGLLAIGEGGLDVEADDHELLRRGLFVYDALYAWCQLTTAARTAAARPS
jgi:hypothetical protein